MTHVLVDFYGGDLEKMRQIRASRVTLRRPGEGWDTAYAALFLASGEAKFITSIQLIVDGGQSCVCP